MQTLIDTSDRLVQTATDSFTRYLYNQIAVLNNGFLSNQSEKNNVGCFIEEADYFNNLF